MAAVVFDESDTHRAIGIALQAAVNGGVDLVAGALGGRTETLAQLEPRHLGDVRGLDRKERCMRARLHRLLVSRLGGRRVDEAEFAHASQYIAAPFNGAGRVGDRIDLRRRLRHARESRRLAERELVQLLAEVGFRRGGHAVRALAEENHVEIEREDFFLLELPLEAKGHEDLLQLATHRLFLREERAARSLHGDRAGALREIRGHQVDEQHAQHALPVESVMLEEAIVLGSDEGLANH